jgi:hypothetical protein
LLAGQVGNRDTFKKPFDMKKKLEREKFGNGGISTLKL